MTDATCPEVLAVVQPHPDGTRVPSAASTSLGDPDGASHLQRGARTTPRVG